MTTDHTETPETEAHLEATRTSPGPNLWASADFARQLETQRNEARAALATAMEERDEARAQRNEALSQLKTLGEELEEATVGQVIAENQATDLRARNDALTKALEEIRDEKVEIFEDGVSADLHEMGIKTVATAYGQGIEDAFDQLKTIARRALGKEGTK